MTPANRPRSRVPTAEPQRTCVGCRRVAPARELVRFVARQGHPVAGAGLTGRGAWLCADTACAERAVRRGALARALRLERRAVTGSAALVHEALLTLAGGQHDRSDGAV